MFHFNMQMNFSEHLFYNRHCCGAKELLCDAGRRTYTYPWANDVQQEDATGKVSDGANGLENCVIACIWIYLLCSQGNPLVTSSDHW